MTTVLQIIPGLGAGGAEQACVDVALALKATGHRAIVVSSGGPRVADIEKAGVEHIARAANSKNPIRIIANVFWLARFIREQKVDVIHARSRAPAWSAYFASRMTGCAFVTTFHAAYKFSNPIKKFYNSVMARADRIIAISHFIARHIADNYKVDPAKIRTIPRGIDFSKFVPKDVGEERRAALRERWHVEADHKLILLPSRLSPIKGQAVLIKAMQFLPSDLGKVMAIILGDDQGRVDYRHALEDMVLPRLQNRIRLVAHCNDMPAAYSLAALVVAPSLVPEGFGRVPVEAMAMGVPVVASDLGGYTETIKSGETGWLVPPNDARKLAAAMIKILRQTPADVFAMTQAAQEHVRRQYDKQKMVADTLAVYVELTRLKAYPPLAGGSNVRSTLGEGSS